MVSIEMHFHIWKCLIGKVPLEKSKVPKQWPNLALYSGKCVFYNHRWVITSIAAAVAVTAAVSAVLERRGYRAGGRKGAVSTHRRDRFG